MFIGVAHNAPADSAVGDAGSYSLKQGHRPEKGYIMTILALRKIVGMASRRAVIGGQRVDTAFEMLAHFGMCENDLTRRFFYVAATQAIHRLGAVVRDLVYIGVTGPNLETRAEYRMMRAWGADLVGMSTVPEVIVGVHMGMEVLGLSVVTDVCDPDHLEPVDIKEIIRTANEAGPILDRLFEETIRKL